VTSVTFLTYLRAVPFLDETPVKDDRAVPIGAVKRVRKTDGEMGTTMTGRKLGLAAGIGLLFTMFAFGSASALVVENRGQDTHDTVLSPLIDAEAPLDYTLNNAHGPAGGEGELISGIVGAEIGDCTESQGRNGYFQSCVKSDGQSAVVGAEFADPDSDGDATVACDNG
jgi:hypothetical protein